MKKFVSENWYKLMIGSSLLMASFGFLIHSVSPVLAKNNIYEFNTNSTHKLSPMGNYSYFVDGGYMYQFQFLETWCYNSKEKDYAPKKVKLP
jgi:hypothetical protein